MNQRTVQLARRQPDIYDTTTANNGAELQDYVDIDKTTGVRFFFATPHHSRERETNENSNGVIRQCIPKRISMTYLTPTRGDTIA